MQRRTYVVSMEVLEDLLRPQKEALERYGIDFQGLIAYSLYFAVDSISIDRPTLTGYEALKQYLVKDLLDNRPGLDASVLHTCMDFVGEASVLLIEYLSMVLGGFDCSIQVERFLGRDLVVSVQIPEPSFLQVPS